MAGVNGIEIKVGQVWRCQDGMARQVRKFDGGEDEELPFLIGDYWFSREGVAHGAEGTDLIELVQDENGFTIWRGGECPVPADAKVSVRFGSGQESSRYPASEWDWHYTGQLGIVAYKVLEQPDASDPKDMAADMLSDLGWHFDGTTWVQDVEVDNERLRLTDIDMNERGYESLADVLQRAYDQAAKGKGKERHARGEPFDEQVMQQGAQRFGVGSLLFQAFKKSEESQRLPQDRAINELLGSIVYLAGAVIALEKGGAK